MKHYRRALFIILLFAKYFERVRVNFATQNMHVKVSMWIKNNKHNLLLCYYVTCYIITYVIMTINNIYVSTQYEPGTELIYI